MDLKPNEGTCTEVAWCRSVAESVRFEKNSVGSVITGGLNLGYWNLRHWLCGMSAVKGAKTDVSLYQRVGDSHKLGL